MNAPSEELKLREIVSQVFQKDLGAITLESRFREDLGADSLDLVVLLHEIERVFGVDIPDSKVAHVRTIEDALNLMKGLRPS